MRIKAYLTRIERLLQEPFHLHKTFIFHDPYGGCGGPEDWTRQCTTRKIHVGASLRVNSWTDFAVLRIAFGECDYDRSWHFGLQIAFWVLDFRYSDRSRWRKSHRGLLRMLIDPTRCVNQRRWEYLGTQNTFEQQAQIAKDEIAHAVGVPEDLLGPEVGPTSPRPLSTRDVAGKILSYVMGEPVRVLPEFTDATACADEGADDGFVVGVDLAKEGTSDRTAYTRSPNPTASQGVLSPLGLNPTDPGGTQAPDDSHP